MIAENALSVLDVSEVEPGIVQIIMHDRVHKNTFSDLLTTDLVTAFRMIADSRHYKVVVLTGYDTYFASGGTQEALLRIHEGAGQFTDVNLYSLALDCMIPVISAMQGHGIGGGFVFGLFSDLVVLSRESVYTTNFMKYGFTPGMGATCILPSKLGIALAEEMLLGAGTFRGADLEKRGIPFPVLPRNEVLPYSLELARQLAEKPRAALITLKAHLTGPLREALPRIVQQELIMHEKTIHEPEVKARINEFFGK